MGYLPTDTTCAGEPYDVYLLPNYNKCPTKADSDIYTCLTDGAVSKLTKSVRGVVNRYLCVCMCV